MKQFRIFCYICSIIMIALILHSLLGDIFFKLKHLNPRVTKTTTEVLSTADDPIQIATDDDDPINIKKRSDKNRIFNLKPQAKYSITGLLVASNSNFFLRDVLRSDFDEICLMDFGLVWGEIGTKKYVQDNLKFKSVKTLGFARQLEYRAKNFNTLPHSWGYISSHLSHTHLIPANTNVTKALLRVKKYDVVKLEGYLVDIYDDKNQTIALTSLSRYDKNETSRGYGACEDMYVISVQIGNKIYK